MEGKYPFNVRVYGICIHPDLGLLLSDERIKGKLITKLPGGGLEYGEGPEECIVREFREETGAEIQVLEHFYTTGFFVPSAFGPGQIISIYYRVALQKDPEFITSAIPFPFSEGKEDAFSLRWISLQKIGPEVFTFPIDKKVGELLRAG